MKRDNQQKTKRCAIYTRKSTEEGLEQEFNSLDAQRESAEAFIASQKAEGWVALPDHYDDGGFTGGNMERPALRRLLTDIEAGKIDCVVVYKVDRLSRSLLDFARMMETFERHRVSFVSVTQQFNTATSMGRLVLNVLLSFAQFEREIISERTRDKIAAARRKGKWTGGHPILGYDVDSTRGKRLVINEDEAHRVKAIFRLYLERQTLLATVAELDNRAWVTKAWTTSKGRPQGGTRFDKVRLFRMLTNVLYTGRVRYRKEIFQGEHPAIVDQETFEQVQRLLKRNGRAGGPEVRNKFGALLRGLIRCSACNCAMIHTNTTRKGTTRYRYYVCRNAQCRGWHTCPSPSVPAPEIERFVVNEIRALGTDGALLEEIVGRGRQQRCEQIEEFQIEQRALQRELASHHAALRPLIPASTSNQHAADRLADIEERIRAVERRMTDIREQIVQIDSELVSAQEMGNAVAAFDPVWESLTPREQIRIVQLLIERVEYDGRASQVSLTFRPAGIRALGGEVEATT